MIWVFGLEVHGIEIMQDEPIPSLILVDLTLMKALMTGGTMIDRVDTPLLAVGVII